MFSCVDVDLYLFLRNAFVHKNRFLFRSSFFLKTIIELSSSSFVSLLISKFLFLSFNELLDIIIRKIVSTCDEIWELLCTKVFWKRDARTESFVIDVLTVSWKRDARTESFVIDALIEESLTNESLWDRSFVDNAFLNSDSLTEWFLNLLNVDSIVFDVWYSSI
jgi:hypothetical protein